MISTAITRMLGIRHPVLSAGMARVAQADLVVAVGNAGGMGCLGGVSYLADALRTEIRDIRARSTTPFAVNVLLPEVLTSDDESQWEPVRQLWNQMTTDQRKKLLGVEALLTPGAVRDQIEVIFEEVPPVVILTFATPPEFVDQCHALGITVGALVGSIGRAEQAAASGVDFLVAQGTEGGGHTGYIGTMVLVHAVVDAVSIPVLAAGGISDGRGLAAALSLGAAGVWVGTRFIASHEAYGHDSFKKRVVDAHSRDTTLTRSYTGKPLRALRNQWTTNWESRQGEIQPFPAQYAVAGARVETGYQDGDLEWGMMPAGQGVETVHAILPAGEIVTTMVYDAEQALQEVSITQNTSV
jgi:enoyl-[acyl-carrier protein] reductase II